MKKLLIIFFILCFNLSYAQYTTIPDTNFEQALIDLNIDSEGIVDSQILTTDAIGIESLDVSNRNIITLEGIAAFSNLIYLNCSGNRINSLDLNANKNLVNLLCHVNAMEILQINECVQLEYLNCAYNSLSELDLHNLTQLTHFFSSNEITDVIGEVQNVFSTLDLSNNINLIEVDCENNYIENLILGNNDELIHLRCSYNTFTDIDLTALINLKYLHIYRNDLTELNLSQNTNLEEAYLGINDGNFNDGISNSFIELDLSQNINLEKLDLSFLFTSTTEVMELDVSSCENLNNLYIIGSYLNFLNIANGNNENLLFTLDGIGLTTPCVQVDNNQIAILANTDQNNWVEADAVIYSADCEETNAVNDNIIKDILVYPNPVITNLNIESDIINNTILYNCLGKQLNSYNSNMIDFSEYTSGVYYLKITSQNNKSIIKKIIKK